ncbi:MAG: twin-arginine translocase TatA/TatE family subunit [Deltaproteobacteria bacterium]|nr:twin-arginine translocase TatA/TatE family subunit [Deltaproteobacteria bacterium]
MFGLGMPEILMILAIALIVIGPKKLPDLAKTLGRAMGEFKRSAQDFKRSIDVETTVKDIKDITDPEIDLKEMVKDVNTKDETTAPSKEMPDKEKKDPDKEPDKTETD